MRASPPCVAPTLALIRTSTRPDSSSQSASAEVTSSVAPRICVMFCVARKYPAREALAMALRNWPGLNVGSRRNVNVSDVAIVAPGVEANWTTAIPVWTNIRVAPSGLVTITSMRCGFSRKDTGTAINLISFPGSPSYQLISEIPRRKYCFNSTRRESDNVRRIKRGSVEPFPANLNARKLFKRFSRSRVEVSRNHYGTTAKALTGLPSPCRIRRGIP